MIEINLIVPFEDRNLIKGIDADRVITAAPHIDGSKWIFVINAEDEEVTFLKLKYGEKNVWKR